MEKDAVVKKLLSRGIMITPQALEEMKDDEAIAFLREEDNKKTTLVKDENAGKLICTVKKTPMPEKITTEDAINDNTMRYEKLRKILLKKVDAVSISNVGRNSTKICVVGLVKEKNADGFTIEDTTGEMLVKTKKNANSDDVVAVNGWMRENVLFADDIIYPDIPINREINVMDVRILLTSEGGAPPQKADAILTPDTLITEGNERRLPNPAWVFLEKDNKNAVVLVYRAAGKMEKETALSWLRKRFICTENGPILNNDMILETVPDILWLIGENEPWTENYKGVSVISFGRRKRAMIDMKARKIEIM